MIKLQGLSKIYHTPAGDYAALHNIDLQVAAGEFVAIVGKSGSGKSTLLNLVGGIDSPTSGTVEVGGTAIQGLDQGRLAAWRGRNVGFVFQFFQLLPTLTVAENVMLPMDFCRTYPVRERRKRALDLLDRVGVAPQADKLPSALSGGEQQRAAIARALVNEPSIILADEPTGNLDSQTGDSILALLSELNRDHRVTVVLVTHRSDAACWSDRTIELRDGRIAREVRAAARARVAG